MSPTLRALSNSTLLFWEDETPLSWAEGSIHFLGLSACYAFATYGFAGRAPIIGPQGGLIAVEFVLALVIVFFGSRLGPVERFGPSFLRLVTVGLWFCCILIGLNFYMEWSEWINDLSEAESRLEAAVTASTIASVLMLVKTVSAEQNPLSVVKRPSLYASAASQLGLLSLLTYAMVIPASSLE